MTTSFCAPLCFWLSISSVPRPLFADFRFRSNGKQVLPHDHSFFRFGSISKRVASGHASSNAHLVGFRENGGQSGSFSPVWSLVPTGLASMTASAAVAGQRNIRPRSIINDARRLALGCSSSVTRQCRLPPSPSLGVRPRIDGADRASDYPERDAYLCQLD